jgi:hypothetical protein
MQYICETYVHRFYFSPIQDELSFSIGEWSPMVGNKFSTDDDDNSDVSDLG